MNSDFIKLNIPFYKDDGDGNQCLQVNLKMVVKYFLNKELSLSELDKMTGRKQGLWTYTLQGVVALHRLGLDTFYYSKEEIEPLLEGEDFIIRHFGKDAEVILKHSDIPAMQDAIKELIQYNIFEKRIVPFEEVEKFVYDGNVVIMLIDWNKILKKSEEYSGHFVILTGYDNENVYVHNPGPKYPEAYMKINKQEFINAWNVNATDNDMVVVKGLRNV